MESQKSKSNFLIGLILFFTLLVSIGGAYLFMNGQRRQRIQKTQRVTKSKEKVIRHYNSAYDASASGTGKHVLRELAITGGLLGGLMVLIGGGNFILKKCLSPEAYESAINVFFAALAAMPRR